MKRSVYLAIITVVTCACVVIGIARHVGIHHTDSVMDIPSMASDSGISADNFSSIDLEVSLADVLITSGNEFSVQASANREKFTPKWVVEDGVLKIRQSSGAFADIIGFKKNESRVIITVPERNSLTNADLSLDVGDIRISGVDIDSLNLESDTGDVRVDNMQAKSVSIESDIGNVDCANVLFSENMDVECDTGNASVTGLSDLESLRVDLDADLGKISFGGNSCGRNFSQNGNGPRLSIQADIGNITVE